MMPGRSWAGVVVGACAAAAAAMPACGDLPPAEVGPGPPDGGGADTEPAECSVEGCRDATACEGDACEEAAPPAADVDVIAPDVDLTKVALTPGRGCAEAPAYVVVALNPDTVHLEAVPGLGCLVAGDEVMLINLQGAGTKTENVGAFETLRVAKVEQNVVTFTRAKTRTFGATAGRDDEIGVDVGEQRVALLRVPTFGTLTVKARGSLTSSRWNGKVGGIIAVRAKRFVVEGTVYASGLGYRGGRWSKDDGDCMHSVATEAGESIGGVGTAVMTANVGGAGGLAPATADFRDQYEPLTASAGHGTAGEPARNTGARGNPQPGRVYGVPDGTKLTMGSGSAGSLTCVGGAFAPFLEENDSLAGGGIVALFGGEIIVAAKGGIFANATPPTNRTAPSGGYILLRGDVVDFASGTVEALGTRASAYGGTYQNTGGAGRIAVHYRTRVAGVSKPEAFMKQTNDL